jgi:hypothetical protein
MAWSWVIPLCIAIALAAFTAGRRAGVRQGRSRALSEAPLQLRRQALLEGVCPICDAPRSQCYNEQTGHTGG